jgi:tetratricopeptide repeat protein 21B
MTKLIETARRVGNLDIIPSVFERAEKYSTRTTLDPGYHYCRGLYELFTGNYLNNFLMDFIRFNL